MPAPELVRDQPMIRVRIPPDLKQWLKDEALRNYTSVNVETLKALREYRDRVEKRAKSKSTS